MRKKFCKRCKKYYMVYRFATEFICPKKHTVLLSKKSKLKLVKKYLKQEKGMRSKLIKRFDKLISDEVKKRVKGLCDKCKEKRARMGCSHYFSRRYIGTRWDLDNLCLLFLFPFPHLYPPYSFFPPLQHLSFITSFPLIFE